MNDETRKITQLIPAVGWRVLGCFIDGDKAVFEELPVIGWALIDHGDGGDDIQLFFYDDGGDGAVCVSEYNSYLVNGLVAAFGPGQDIGDFQKSWLENQVRRRMSKTRKEVVA